jgi:glc operon protein GlcG
MRSVGPPGAGAACALTRSMLVVPRGEHEWRENVRVRLERALAIVDFVVSEASAPVSVFVADGHGEIVAAATMDGAAPDTRLNAQRKAYTAARSDARTTRELADKARTDAVERASFDPFFTFFLGGVAVFEDGERVGAVGVSGLPGEVDERLALAAIERSADR